MHTRIATYPHATLHATHTTCARCNTYTAGSCAHSSCILSLSLSLCRVPTTRTAGIAHTVLEKQRIRSPCFGDPTVPYSEMQGS